MIQAEVTQITGGTYTAGGDCSAQFDDSTAAGYLQTFCLSSNGEIYLPYCSAGRRARFAVNCPNGPSTVNFYIENNGGGADGPQVQVSGAIVNSYAAAAADSFTLPLGVSIVSVMFQKGSLCFAAAFAGDQVNGVYPAQWPMYAGNKGGSISSTGVHTI